MYRIDFAIGHIIFNLRQLLVSLAVFSRRKKQI